MKNPLVRFFSYVFLSVVLTGLLSGQTPPAGLLAPSSAPGLRTQQLLDGPWRFKFSDKVVSDADRPTLDDHTWSTVTVPHTWSGPDGSPTGSNCWYRLAFDAKKTDDRRTYLYFEGAATVIDVYVNGLPVGSHRGAYTAAIFDATEALDKSGKNVLAVRVSNDRQETIDCLPCTQFGTTQLYKLYGGIYRKVWLLTTPATHIYPEMASSGVFISQTGVTAERAELYIRTAVQAAQAGPLTVRHLVRDAQGKQVALFEGTVEDNPGAPVSAVVKGIVNNPTLWSPDNPYLYTVETDLLSQGKLVDAVTETMGLRHLTLDPEKGFSLNGHPIILRGINKHQETEYNLTAVSDDDLRQDWKNIQDLGANCVRLPHYPHARLEYDLADRDGILVWAENGNSNRHVFTLTGERITREMVRQNFNHPSIVFWSCGNETGEDETSTAYAKVIREEDSTRLVTYASNGKSPGDLDFQAWNVYPYWYEKGDYKGGDARVYPRFKYFSEYGVGGSIATHCAFGAETKIVDKYEPEEYQQLMLERVMPTLFGEHAADVPFFTWWTFREFGDAKFKGRNTKGMLTYSNFRKDIFYLYQSYLRPSDPVLHICGKTHFVRLGDSSRGLKVYGNAQSVKLTLNGRDLGEKTNGQYAHLTGKPIVDNVFSWNVPLDAGRNEVVVTDNRGQTDRAVIYALPTGATMPAAPTAVVQALVSSNPASPAYFVADSIRDQEPVYYQCDGQADNTFDVIPEALQGAYRIATRRLSDLQNVTDLTFKIAANARDADIFVLTTGPTDSPLPGVRRDLSVANPAFERMLSAHGFAKTAVQGLWRDNLLSMVGTETWSRRVHPGDTITVPGAALDYVILLKPAAD